MNSLQIDSLNFSIHIILLGVKIWSCYYILGSMKNIKSNTGYMFTYKIIHVLLFLFTVVYTVYEIYFIYTFFIPTPIYQYEYIAMIDQIIFTLISIKYLIKEKK